MHAFNKYKEFNPNKRRLKPFQVDIVQEQPDAPWLALPNEINCIVLSYITLDSYSAVERVCKQLSKIIDRRVEKYAFENTLARCDYQERQGMLDWWHDLLKLRAYSFNDPSLIEEYMDFKVNTTKIAKFCLIESISDILLSRLYAGNAAGEPRQELKSIIAFDADAIVEYFIEVFEEDFKDKSNKWALMADNSFHQFLWCLLVAFEQYIDPIVKGKQLKPDSKILPLFLTIMSKYSPPVIRLLLTPELSMGRKGFPLLKTTPYRVFQGLMAHKEKFPWDLTSTLANQYDIIDAPNSFYNEFWYDGSDNCLRLQFPPLLLACYICNQQMFIELAKHTPVIPSDAYFAAVARSSHHYEERAYFYDLLAEKNIDINAKVTDLLKGSIVCETILGIVCFDYRNNDRSILIEWLLRHGARFSENELTVLNASESTPLIVSIKSILEAIQNGKYDNSFKTSFDWTPTLTENYHQLAAASVLTFSENDGFSVKLQKTTYTGKWKRGTKPNHIICTADKATTEIILHNSYSDYNEPIVSPSSKTFDFFAYKTWEGRTILLKEDASYLAPRMELMSKAWVNIVNESVSLVK